MNRREVLLLGLGALALPVWPDRNARAENPRPRRVGILAPAPLHPIASFKDRLRALGWVEGSNIRFEDRWAQGDEARYAALAAELAALPVDLLLTWSTPAVLAAKRATATIPIVMAAIADPVGVGAVSSLARPGGNVTGFSTQNYELETKRLELLRELVPGMRRIALLANTTNSYAMAAMPKVKAVAEAGGLTVDALALDVPGELEAGLARLKRGHPDGVLVLAAPALFPHRRELAEFMTANRLPAVYPFPQFAEVGGLISYSTNFDDLFQQAADYVDRILRGAAPGALPVQQAATFQLIVNLKAAGAIGLTVPPSVLIRADEVIE